MIFIIVALVLKAHSAVQQVKMAKPDETLDDLTFGGLKILQRLSRSLLHWPVELVMVFTEVHLPTLSCRSGFSHAGLGNRCHRG